MSKLLIGLLVSTTMSVSFVNANEPLTIQDIIYNDDTLTVQEIIQNDKIELDETPLDDEYQISTIDMVEGCVYLGKITFVYSFAYHNGDDGAFDKAVARFEKNGFKPGETPLLAEAVYDDLKEHVKEGIKSQEKFSGKKTGVELMMLGIEKSLDNFNNVAVNCVEYYLAD